MLTAWTGRWKRWRESRDLARRAVPDVLWQTTLARYPFLAQRSAEDLDALRRMSSLFLARKEFTGANGLQVDDAMAVAVAAQACLPVLKLGLDAYDGWVGIVIHPDAVVAEREHVDDDGVVHEFEEVLSGEAMSGGPVMLSWSDVAGAGDFAQDAYNVVIHEFAHVLDMADGSANGMPSLPDTISRARWTSVLQREYESFCTRIDRGEDTALDPYGAEAPEEFFAVATEAFFVAPQAMQADHPMLYALFAAYFLQDPAASADSA